MYKSLIVYGILYAILCTFFTGCNTMKKVLNKQEKPVQQAFAWYPQPQPPLPSKPTAYESLEYFGRIPSPTFILLPEGGEAGSYVEVYVRTGVGEPWIAVPKYTGTGDLAYAYESGSSVGPTVRLMHTDQLPYSKLGDPEGWIYYIYLVRPIQHTNGLY